MVWPTKAGVKIRRLSYSLTLFNVSNIVGAVCYLPRSCSSRSAWFC